MSSSESSSRSSNRYLAILEHIFFANYEEGDTVVSFEREEMETAATTLGIPLPKNLGDVVYSVRYRSPLPSGILATQSEGMEWIIEGAGRGKYEFRLVRINRVLPRTDLVTIQIPDSTPEIIAAYAMGDEQALLAIVRYNRLIDIFLGITAYSLQNHLRTTLTIGSQIEIDEMYVALDQRGRHYIIPVQAKGGSDRISTVQTRQDIQFCTERFPSVICRAVASQFMTQGRIAMFELAVEEDEIRVAEERHYQLVPRDQLDLS